MGQGMSSALCPPSTPVPTEQQGRGEVQARRGTQPLLLGTPHAAAGEAHGAGSAFILGSDTGWSSPTGSPG